MENSEILKTTFKPTVQPFVGRNMSKRRLLSQAEPTVHVCSKIEELSIVLDAQLQACRQLAMPVALITMEVMNFDELTDPNMHGPDALVNKVAHHLMSVVRAQDVLVQYGGKFIACLVVDADQNVAAKVCQRIKESVHKYSFLHKSICPIQLEFGIADDSLDRSEQLEVLLFAAAKSLEFAHHLGDGAIVRALDLDQSIDESPKEHFVPGDRLTSRND
jgi:diguanylate cyclase (GGDEF)-like protein